MPIKYKITYNESSSPDVCSEEASTSLRLDLVGDGVAYHSGTNVEFLDLHFVPNGTGSYNSNEEFSLYLNYAPTGASDVEPIHKSGSGDATCEASHQSTYCKLTIGGPSSEGTLTNFDLDWDGSTPDKKLKIRVKRDPNFTCP